MCVQADASCPQHNQTACTYMKMLYVRTSIHSNSILICVHIVYTYVCSLHKSMLLCLYAAHGGVKGMYCGCSVAMAMCSDQIQIWLFRKDVLVYVVHRIYGCLMQKNICKFMIQC